jgi:uncharacterized membrane protein YeaQ/YmgE (transglycosylase-associated protein family)
MTSQAKCAIHFSTGSGTLPFIASKIVNKSGSGVATDIVLGIVGAVVGGWLFDTLNGELRLCRSESHCSDQAFAGATASTDANNGTFAAGIFPTSTFTFSFAPSGIFKLDLTGSHNLRASGILRPDYTSAEN